MSRLASTICKDKHAKKKAKRRARIRLHLPKLRVDERLHFFTNGRLKVGSLERLVAKAAALHCDSRIGAQIDDEIGLKKADFRRTRGAQRHFRILFCRLQQENQ